VRSPLLQRLGAGLQIAAPYTAGLSLACASVIGFGVHQEHNAVRDELATPIDNVAYAVDDTSFFDPHHPLTLATAIKAARHANPGTTIVAGTPARLRDLKPGTFVVSARGTNPVRFTVAYEDPSGRVQRASVVPTVEYPDGDWQYQLSLPHWQSASVWFGEIFGAGLGLSGLLALLGLAGTRRGRRPLVPTEQLVTEIWQRLVPDTGEFGPREPQEDFVIFTPEHFNEVDEAAGTVIVHFRACASRWTKNNFTETAQKLLDITTPYYWGWAGEAKADELPEALRALPRSWPADTLTQQLSESWFDFCQGVADWNRGRWEEAQQALLVEEAKQTTIEEQLKVADILALPSAAEGFIPASAPRPS
jgi:hypothetical protein